MTLYLLDHTWWGEAVLADKVVHLSVQSSVTASAFTARTCVCMHGSLRNFFWINSYLISLSFKFRKDPSIRWGDIQLLVTMYISYYTLNYSQFSPENFDFFGTPSYWYFLILSFPWQFLIRRKKNHAISIKNYCVRRPRVQTFWWHSPNRDSCPGTFQPYVRYI